jgi:hypothetical protein
MFPILRFLHTLYIVQLDSVVELIGKKRQFELYINVFWNPVVRRALELDF